MEYWDLYDYKGNKKDKIALRGSNKCMDYE